MYRLESFSPLSGCWFQSGPEATDLSVLRRELDQSKAVCGVVALRIVSESGEVVAEYNPEAA